MIDLQTFLMRWFFVCNLIRDVADVQTLPYNPDLPHQDLRQPPVQQQSNLPPPPRTDRLYQQYTPYVNGYPPHSVYDQDLPQQHIPYVQTPAPRSLNAEEDWRHHCLRWIRNYPQGTHRCLVMDAMRLELVQQLNQYLSYADFALQRIRGLAARQPFKQDETSNINDFQIVGSMSRAEGLYDPDFDDTYPQGIDDVGPNEMIYQRDPDGLLVSNQGAINKTDHLQIVSEDEIANNKRSTKQIRLCMPQLVSAVLRSPAPFDPNLVNPVRKLREIILSRCQADPSWGIELCWLLEAEVGHAWKRLFEHRQQTGKRLIVVMPADKAAVLAQIGPKKQEAFDLLQDVERVTAYGYPSDHETWQGDRSGSPHRSGPTARPPSSLSLLRCSHFGDTMHFIDQLTQISLDLRRVPAIQRHAYLQDALYEMNRRLRRRMITRGEISLGVDDNLGPYDWPEMKDLTLDMLKHSVHFPLVPDQGTWPSGRTDSSIENTRGVMQVLNIVVPEARILASRERCPFLVRLEVAETGLDGSDARLYAAGVRQFGAAVGEAMYNGVPSRAQCHGSQQSRVQRTLPFESAHSLSESHIKNSDFMPLKNEFGNGDSETFPRGGWQVQSGGTDFIHGNPYEAVRENEYEQLHQHRHDTQISSMPPQGQRVRRPAVSTGEALLNRVFGLPWTEVCDEVRRKSPYCHIMGWSLASFILKAGEDIRREALVMQMISKFRDWFEEEIPEENRPFLKPYTIMCVGGDAGLLECLTDAKSVDELKKKTDGFLSLRDFFERAYGPPQSSGKLSQMGERLCEQAEWPNIPTFEQAQENFLRSLVGYSLVCYILQIKDRHNANILLDRAGHIIHIDFGFVLGDTPRMGKVPIFSERAPFKLSNEFWEVLGGWNWKTGGLGVRFCEMFEEAFACASTHSEELASLVEGIMLTLHDNPAEARSNAQRVRSRIRMRGPPGSSEQKLFIMDLVNSALTSWGTSTYDWLQKNMNGYQ